MNSARIRFKGNSSKRIRLGLRCDGGPSIGLGHVVGCVRLASLLSQELGVGIEFIVREDQATLDVIHRTGFPVEVVPQDIAPGKDIDRLVEKAIKSGWSGVIINFCKDDLDRYTSLFDSIKEANIKLIFMDNPVPTSYMAGDLLINALPHPNYVGYDPVAHPNCYDGLEYFIPDPDILPPKHRVSPVVKRVLVAMGGADPLNLTVLVLQGLAEAGFDGYVDAVLGAACSHREAVRQFLKDAGLNGAVSVNVSDMPQRMSKADIGFSALGLTTYEMAYLQLPVCIIVGMELNARAAEQYVQSYGAAEYLGHKRAVGPNDIASWFVAIAGDVERRNTLSAAGHRIGSARHQLAALVGALL